MLNKLILRGTFFVGKNNTAHKRTLCRYACNLYITHLNFFEKSSEKCRKYLLHEVFQHVKRRRRRTTSAEVRLVPVAMQQPMSIEKLSGSTIVSFTLLGLSFDHYPTLTNYQLTTSSFDRTNEKLLLHLLHFLLIKLDASFAANVSCCWPYFEVKEKNEFKRIVSSFIAKVSSSNPNLSNADFRTSLLTVAKGSAVWVLLGRLCDTALELSIRALTRINQIQSSVTMSMDQSASLWDILTTTDINRLTTAIGYEYRCITIEGSLCMARQDEQIAFSSELDSRLQAATKKRLEAKLEMSKISNSEEVKYLSESSQIERSELIFRIKEMYAALKQLSKSSTFTDCDPVAAFYSDQQSPPKLLPQSMKFSEEIQLRKSEYMVGKFGRRGKSFDIEILENDVEDKEKETVFNSTSYKNAWHLDASSILPLTRFLDSYTSSKVSKIRSRNSGKCVLNYFVQKYASVVPFLMQNMCLYYLLYFYNTIEATRFEVSYSSVFSLLHLVKIFA